MLCICFFRDEASRSQDVDASIAESDMRFMTLEDASRAELERGERRAALE